MHKIPSSLQRGEKYVRIVLNLSDVIQSVAFTPPMRGQAVRGPPTLLTGKVDRVNIKQKHIGQGVDTCQFKEYA